jgi:hypothetical protein
MLVGSHCDSTCDKRLINVFCNPISKKCECLKNYSVKIGKYAVNAHENDFYMTAAAAAASHNNIVIVIA